MVKSWRFFIDKYAIFIHSPRWWSTSKANVEMSAASDFHFELAISGRVSKLPVNTSVPRQELDYNLWYDMM